MFLMATIARRMMMSSPRMGRKVVPFYSSYVHFYASTCQTQRRMFMCLSFPFVFNVVEP
jgi:hypothetical protein